MNFESFKFHFESEPVEELVSSNLIANPQMSICVQTYQHQEFIEDCLNNILKQETDFSYEILIGEDASNDGTREICKSFLEKNDNVRLFLHHRANNIKIGQKPTGRFNLLYNFYQAKGKYIALCEGDDFWSDPYKLQKQFDFLEQNNEYVLSFHDCYRLNSDQKIIGNYLEDNYKRDFSSFELGTAADLPTLSNVFRNVSSVQNPPKEFTEIFNGDDFLYFLLSKYGKAHFHADIKEAYYRMHDGGIYSGTAFSYKLKQGLVTKITIYKLTEKEPNEEFFKEKLAFSFRNILKMSLKQWSILSIPFALLLALIFKMNFIPKRRKVDLSLAILRLNWTFNLNNQVDK